MMSSRGLACKLPGDFEIAGRYEGFDDNQEHQEEGLNHRSVAGFNDVFTPFTTSSIEYRNADYENEPNGELAAHQSEPTIQLAPEF